MSLQCGACGATNPDGAKFCAACGQSLARGDSAQSPGSQSIAYRVGRFLARRRNRYGALGIIVGLVLAIVLISILAASPGKSEPDDFAPVAEKMMQKTMQGIKDLTSFIGTEVDLARATRINREIADMAEEAYWNVPIPVSGAYVEAGHAFVDYEQEAARVANSIYEGLRYGYTPNDRTAILEQMQGVVDLAKHYQACMAAGR